MPAITSSPITKNKSAAVVAVKKVSRTPGRKTPVKAAAATKKTEKKSIEMTILGSPSKKKKTSLNNNNKNVSSPASPKKKTTPINKKNYSSTTMLHHSDDESSNQHAPPLPFFSSSAPVPPPSFSSQQQQQVSFDDVKPTIYYQDLPLQQKQMLEKGIPIDPSYVYHGKHPHGELGLGTTQFPFRQTTKNISNNSGCFHCPSDTCICNAFQELLQKTIADCDMRRETDGRPGRKDLCAKSLNPNFVARLVREMNIESGDTFFDFGSGNGSILFQVAAQVPGVKCIGVELNDHNAELSRRLWTKIQPGLSNISGIQAKNFSMEIIAGDALELVSKQNFWQDATNKRTGKGPVILCNNVLWPRPVTHFIQERCRDAPIDTRICCFDDFFPHGRSVCQSRDPEAFELFEMKDYFWSLGAVEWSPLFEGRFFIHRKIQNREDLEIV